jgi:hypothetical protein
VATLHEDQLLGCLRAEARSKYPCLKACAEGAVDSSTIGEGGMATVGSRFMAKGTLCCTKELKLLGENCYTPLAAAFEIKALLHLRHDNVLRGARLLSVGQQPEDRAALHGPEVPAVRLAGEQDLLQEKQASRFPRVHWPCPGPGLPSRLPDSAQGCEAGKHSLVQRE